MGYLKEVADGIETLFWIFCLFTLQLIGTFIPPYKRILNKEFVKQCKKCIRRNSVKCRK